MSFQPIGKFTVLKVVAGFVICLGRFAVVNIYITDKYGVFYVCPYCWENNDLQTILKATTQGYLSQFHSCSTDEDKAHFLEEHKLVDILMKTEQKYISTHSEKQEK